MSFQFLLQLYLGFNVTYLLFLVFLLLVCSFCRLWISKIWQSFLLPETIEWEIGRSGFCSCQTLFFYCISKKLKNTEIIVYFPKSTKKYCNNLAITFWQMHICIHRLLIESHSFELTNFVQWLSEVCSIFCSYSLLTDHYRYIFPV